MKSPETHFGRQLRALRGAAKQTDWCEALGLNPSGLSRLEQGRRKPSVVLIIKLARLANPEHPARAARALYEAHRRDELAPVSREEASWLVDKLPIRDQAFLEYPLRESIPITEIGALPFSLQAQLWVLVAILLSGDVDITTLASFLRKVQKHRG